MRCYLVTFEVTDAVLGRLEERLKTYSTYCPIHRNCWALVTDQSAVDIRNNLGQVLTSVDRLFVVRSGVEAAWRNSYGQKHSEWLQKNL